jgi:hypothetical protein
VQRTRGETRGAISQLVCTERTEIQRKCQGVGSGASAGTPTSLAVSFEMGMQMQNVRSRAMRASSLPVAVSNSFQVQFLTIVLPVHRFTFRVRLSALNGDRLLADYTSQCGLRRFEDSDKVESRGRLPGIARMIFRCCSLGVSLEGRTQNTAPAQRRTARRRAVRTAPDRRSEALFTINDARTSPIIRCHTSIFGHLKSQLCRSFLPALLV